MLMLDYDKALLTIDAPGVQRVVGDLSSAPVHKTSLLECSSKLVNACFLLVSLDGGPIRESKRMLLQTMAEEKPTDFRVERRDNGRRRIANIGRDPWLVRELEGRVRFLAPDAGRLRTTKLDADGAPIGEPAEGAEVTLDPKTVYYLVDRQ